MKNSLFLLFIMIFVACGKSESKKYFAQTTLEDFSTVINKKSSLKQDEVNPYYIEDKDYYRGKIKLYLFDDQTFKFEFADYSTNEGKWRFEDNSLQLEGYLSWIPLNMYVFKKSADDKEFFLQFTDAQGTKTRNLEIKK